jgi:hypothetical protein
MRNVTTRPAVVLLRNVAFWDVTPCGYCKERITSINRVKEISELGTTSAATTVIRSSETSFLTRATRLHTPEDGILHRHHREDLKSYIVLSGLAQ